MAHPRLTNQELLSKLAEVFRARGYDGASLGDLAEAAELEKASLYHRFPGGKEEMVTAVIASVDECFEENLFAPLRAPGEPTEKAQAAALFFKTFYDDGKKACTLDTLSLPSAIPAIRSLLQRSATALLNSLAGLARESGFPAAEAKLRAQRAIVLLEGSLVYARALGDTKPFREFIAELPVILTGGTAGGRDSKTSTAGRTK